VLRSALIVRRFKQSAATKRFQKAGALIMESTIAIVTIAVLRLIRGLLTDEQLDTIYGGTNRSRKSSI
jgi:hypothetical protein